MLVLRNTWYMAAWSSELAPGDATIRTIADDPIHVERRDDGEFVAYSARDNSRFFVLYEQYKILWIWLGSDDRADPALIPNYSFLGEAKSTAFFTGHLPIAANYELLTDNIMDLSHADFLHPDTFGGGAVTRTSPQVRRYGEMIVALWEAKNDVALPIFDRLLPTPGQPADLRLEVQWHAPAVMMLHAQVAPANEPFERWFDARAVHIMTPETEFSTHYFFGGVRNYRVDDATLNSMQAESIRRVFATEDKPIIEAQQVAMGTSDLWSLNPVLLPSDAGAVQVRRMLERLIAIEQGGL